MSHSILPHTCFGDIAKALIESKDECQFYFDSSETGQLFDFINKHRLCWNDICFEWIDPTTNQIRFHHGMGQYPVKFPFFKKDEKSNEMKNV
jgi:hypothetical protein